jgi:hypothetical protein
MHSIDDLQYALENTKVIHSPDRRIESFGTTQFRFYLVTEFMDSVDKIRVRDGNVRAERPQIVTPENLSKFLLDGFGEAAQDFANIIESRHAAMLKYGFQIRKDDLSEEVVHDSLETVIARIDGQIPESQRSASAIIQGVDEGWEVCLLKFTFEMIQQSAGINLFDFKRKGLL